MKSLGHNTLKCLIRDHFVKLAFKILQYKTGVVEDTTDPEFNEEFSFNLSRWIGSIAPTGKIFCNLFQRGDSGQSSQTDPVGP